MGRGQSQWTHAVEHRQLPWTHALPIAVDRLSETRRADLEGAIAALGLCGPIAGAPPEPLYEPMPNPMTLPDNVPRVLGVCGKPRAGKDVIADFIAAHYRDVKTTSFSASVIPEVNGYLEAQGSPHRITMGNKSAPIYRALLQAWGLAQPSIDPDYWVRKTRNWIETQLRSGTRLVLVTGVRLPPDVEMIKGIGGQTWRAVRPDNPYQAEHDVESGIDQLAVDSEIVNPVEGDLAPYEKNITAALHC